MTDDRASIAIPDDTTLDKAVPRNSKYLGKDDVDPPLLVQIFQMTTDQVEGDGGVLEERAVLHFHGDVKPWIVNPTNRELLKGILGATTGPLGGRHPPTEALCDNRVRGFRVIATLFPAALC